MNIRLPRHPLTRFMFFSLSLILLALSGCSRETPAPSGSGSAGVAVQDTQQAAHETTPMETQAGPDRSGLILVTGITGQQGGAVADELSARGYHLRGLTRDTAKPAAQALEERGIEMSAGDFSDPDSIQSALTGVYGVFLNTPNGPEEVSQGKTFIDSARAAGVRHIIYSTYTSADPELGRPGMPKAEVESYLRDSGIGYTILRPVTFMENFARMKSVIPEAGIRDPRKPDTKMLYISVKDIALFTAEAFDDPGNWLGRELNIASDTFTNPELAEILSRVTGSPIEYTQISWEEWGMPPPLVEMYQWYETSGFTVDVASLREQYPQLYTIERYFRENGWEELGKIVEPEAETQ